MRQPPFLPMDRNDMLRAGWDVPDILLVSGDAYVDHPSFGVALLGRWLVARGFRVGVVAQPRWRDKEAALADLTAMGRPRLFAGITAGAIDSMLAHYTAFRKKRSDDAYTPGGLAGARPNRACIAYTGLVRQAFPGLPVVLGGIEASLRRASHYDFWDNSLRRPILQDSKADLLVCGMGERALLAIAERADALLRQNSEVSRAVLLEACRDLPGLALMMSANTAPDLPGLTLNADSSGPGAFPDSGSPDESDIPADSAQSAIILPAHEAILADPALLMRATLDLERHAHTGGRRALQRSGDRVLVLNPPAEALNRDDMDFLYGLTYSRLPHPRYRQPVPAWEMIRTSITSHRGCGGGCSFCSLALHQGRRVSSRSRDSILKEAALIAAGPGANTEPSAAKASRTPHAPDAKPPRWAGSISDVGGPSANMWQAACSLPPDKECRRSSCLHPAPCPRFVLDQRQGVRLLRDIAALPGIRHVRVASGLRFDLALRDEEALRAYTLEFTGGQLKVAPEHSEAAVLRLMRKPEPATFERFLQRFSDLCRQAGKEQYVIPYLMSAFPGCTEAHMRALADWLKKRNWRPQQVQCFIPTPGTVATAMFYAGITPDGQPLAVARSDADRLRQHHLLAEPAVKRKTDKGRERQSGGKGKGNF